MRPGELFPVGSQVTVPGVGEGEVVRLDSENRVIRFPQHGNLEVSFPADRLRGERGPATSPAERTLPGAVHPDGVSGKASEVAAKAGETVRTTYNTRQTIGHDELKFRRAIDALRFGLVPEQSVQAITVGIEELTTWVLTRLPRDQQAHPLVSEVQGPFGTGKSHTMAVIRNEARKQGFLTARVEVDGKGVTLADPAKLLYLIWSSLQGTGLSDLYPILSVYEAAVRAGMTASRLAPTLPESARSNFTVIEKLARERRLDQVRPGYDALLSCSTEVTAAEIGRAIGWTGVIRATGARPKSMMPSQLYARPYGFVGILAAHAYLAKLAGFEGLVLTIDEFEVEQSATPASRRKAAQVLNAIEEYLTGKLGLPPANLAVFFATVTESERDGDVSVSRMVQGAEAQFHLKPWTRSEREELAERIHGIYCHAYDVNAEFSLDTFNDVEQRLLRTDAGGDGLVRAFIKRWVQELDYAHGPSLDKRTA